MSGIILKTFLQTGFLYQSLKPDLLSISRLNCSWLGLNKFLQILKDISSFELPALSPSSFSSNKKVFVYLMNKYLFDEFFQNCIIEQDDDANLSSLEESTSRIDEASKEDEDSQERSSSRSIEGEGKSLDKLISPENFLFFSGVGKSESIAKQKESFIVHQRESQKFTEESKEQEQEEIGQKEESPDEENDSEEKGEKTEEESRTGSTGKLKKKPLLKKLSTTRMNQRKRSNLMLSPSQNYVNVAYEKSGTRDMKQSALVSAVEGDSEAIMRRLEKCEPKINREEVLNLPFEIFREHWKLVEGSDKGKEATAVRTSFETRNGILYYNRAFFSEKVEVCLN